MNLEEFAHPRSVEDALALLAAGKGEARPLAGGTSLALFKCGCIPNRPDLSSDLSHDFLRQLGLDVPRGTRALWGRSPEAAIGAYRGWRKRMERK